MVFGIVLIHSQPVCVHGGDHPDAVNLEDET